MVIVEGLSSAEQRELRWIVQRSRDRDEVRRALSILRLAEGCAVGTVANLTEAARSSRVRGNCWKRQPAAGKGKTMKLVDELFEGHIDIVGDLQGEHDALQRLLGKLGSLGSAGAGA